MVTSKEGHYSFRLKVKGRRGGQGGHGESRLMKVGLRREDALCRSKWSVGINHIAAGFG